MKKVLVTGASGFVGRFLCARLLAGDWKVRGAIRSSKDLLNLNAGIETTVVEPLGPYTNWISALEGIDTVIHLAARVHIMNDLAADPLAEFRRVNVAGTVRLASEAAAAGVRRFAFISSIGVNGSESGSSPFTENDRVAPHNPYSISKYEAEQALWQISGKTGLKVVIIRAPLVYGPGNPGNFLSLLRIVSKSIPLPLASVINVRSLLYAGNLADALTICATHPSAESKTYLVSDGEDVSTPELIQQLASALGKPARLFPFPPGLLRLAGRLSGKSTAVQSLIGSLQVDSSKIRRELGWIPQFTMEQGLKKTAEWYTNQTRHNANQSKIK